MFITSLRIPDKLADRIKADATRCKRSLNGHIEFVIERHLQRVLSEDDENFRKQRIEFFDTEV